LLSSNDFNFNKILIKNSEIADIFPTPVLNSQEAATLMSDLISTNVSFIPPIISSKIFNGSGTRASVTVKLIKSSENPILETPINLSAYDETSFIILNNLKEHFNAASFIDFLSKNVDFSILYRASLCVPRSLPINFSFPWSLLDPSYTLLLENFTFFLQHIHYLTFSYTAFNLILPLVLSRKLVSPLLTINTLTIISRIINGPVFSNFSVNYSESLRLATNNYIHYNNFIIKLIYEKHVLNKVLLSEDSSNILELCSKSLTKGTKLLEEASCAVRIDIESINLKFLEGRINSYQHFESLNFLNDMTFSFHILFDINNTLLATYNCLLIIIF